MKKKKIYLISVSLAIALFAIAFFYGKANISTDETTVVATQEQGNKVAESISVIPEDSSALKNDGEHAVVELMGSEELRSTIVDFNQPYSTKSTPDKTTNRVDDGKSIADPEISDEKLLEEVNLLLAQSGADFNKNYALDIAMQNFLKDNTLSRFRKIFSLWGLANDLISEQKFDRLGLHYLLDSIAFLQPIELTDDIIAFLSQRSLPPEINLRLMTLLADSFKMYGQMDTKALDESAQALVITSGDKIREYFNQAINDTSDISLFKQAVNLFPGVAAPEDYYLLDEAIQVHKDVLPVSDILSARLDFAVMDADMMVNNLPALLSSLENSQYKNEDITFIESRLIAFSKDNLLAAEAGSLPDELRISDAVRQEFSGFLASKEQDFTDADFQSDSLFKSIEYADWFLAYSLVSTGNKDERVAFTSEYLDRPVGVYKKRAIIEGIIAANDAELIDVLKQNQNLQSELMLELQKPELSESEVSRTQSVLDKLQE